MEKTRRVRTAFVLLLGMIATLMVQAPAHAANRINAPCARYYNNIDFEKSYWYASTTHTAPTRACNNFKRVYVKMHISAKVAVEEGDVGYAGVCAIQDYRFKTSTAWKYARNHVAQGVFKEPNVRYDGKWRRLQGCSVHKATNGSGGTIEGALKF